MAVFDEFAAFITDTIYDEIPGEVVDEAKLSLLDIIGALLIGEKSELGELIDGLNVPGAPREATVLPSGKKTDALSVIQVNSSAAHCSEIDNIHPGAIVCIGGMVVPAALAWAERNKRSGRDLLAAIVIGSEAGIRLGASVFGGDLLKAGWWPSSIFGAFGVCAAVARLEGLTEYETRQALSICSTMCGGFINGGAEGATARHFMSGWSSRCGAASVLAAKAGFTGPLDALEISQGAMAARGLVPDFAGAVKGLGSEYRLSETVYKSYASAMQSQSAVSAFLRLKETYSLKAKEIDSVCVELPPRAFVVVQSDGVPESHTTAAAHGKYLIAAAISDGDILPAQFDKEKIFDPEIRSFMKKVSVRQDKKLEKYAGKWPARVFVSCKDGKSYDTEVIDWMEGVPRKTFVEKKFKRVLKAAGEANRTKTIMGLVTGLETANGVRNLIAAICD